MKRIFCGILLAGLACGPSVAQDDGDDGFSLMEEGAELLFRGLMNEMAPAIRDLEGFAEEMQPALRMFLTEMGPAFTSLLRKVDDISNYELPEFLPNGDIIIRRKQDAPVLPDFDPDADIEI